MKEKDRSYNVMKLPWNLAQPMGHLQSKCNYVAFINAFLYFYYSTIGLLLLHKSFAVNCYFILDRGLLSPGFSLKIKNLERFYNIKLTILPSLLCYKENLPK